jgi:transposase
MSMGRRPMEQQEAWVATTDLPRSPGHPFYQKLNELLAEADFDGYVEKLCAPYYANDKGRPSIPPGTYFRMILIGYFEGISSQRGIAWRCSDSRSLATFLGVPITKATPDHSSLSRIHPRLPFEIHAEVFRFVLRIAADKKLLHGKTVAVDATTLEANAAMKSIVRKESGEDYQAYLRRLAEEAGLENPTDEELRRFDKNRPDKKVSNEEWESKTDPGSRITQMKDGTTHLAYKGEHVVDLESNLMLAAEVYPADQGDTTTIVDSLMAAQTNLVEAQQAPIDRTGTQKIEEATADRGYHAAGLLAELTSLGLRTYVAEKQRRSPWRWSEHTAEERAAVQANHRRVCGNRGKGLQRSRSEQVERSFAHVCETGGGRRCWLRGLTKVAKRYLLQGMAHNLGVLMRKLFGMGTPRSLQGAGGGPVFAFFLWYWRLEVVCLWLSVNGRSRSVSAPA